MQHFLALVLLLVVEELDLLSAALDVQFTGALERRNSASLVHRGVVP